MSPNSISTAHTSSNHHSQPTAQACAACKYQRRKCKPDCILAPFFPADHLRQFLNAHRLFGVKKILKIVTGLDPVLRARAMDSIIFEYNARAQDPVGGCLRIINQLHYQLQRDAADLSIVLGQLAFYREQAQQTQAQDNQQLIPAIQPNVSINPIFNMGGGDDIYAPAAAAINQQEFILDHTLQQQQQQQYCHDYFYFNGDDNNNVSSNSNSNSNSNSINNYNSNGNVVEMDVPLSMLCLQQEEGEEEDEKSLADVFAVREEFGQDAEAGAAASLHCRLGLGFQSSSEFS